MAQDTRVSRQPGVVPRATMNHDQGTPPVSASAAPPRSLIEILLHRKWTVVLWVIVAVGLGALYQHYAPPKFESSAEIVVLRANPDAPASPLSSAGLSASAPTTHARMIVSTPVLAEALADPALADATLFADEPDPIRYLRKQLIVTASDETETVNIRFQGANPHEVADLVAAIVHAYFRQQGLAVRGMGEVTEDQPTTLVMDEELIASQMMFLSEQVATAQIESELAQSRLARGRAAGRDVNQLQQLLTEAGADTQTLGLLTLVTLSAQLNQLDQQVRSMPESWGPDHRLRAPLLRQRETLILQYEVAEQGVIQQALDLLQAEAIQTQQQHQRMESGLADLQARAAVARTAPVRVIEPPRVATRKSSPLAAQTFGIAGFVGLALGGFFAVRAEMREPAAVQPQSGDGWGVSSFPAPVLLRGQEDMERIETVRDVPMLGTVPELSTGRRLTTPNFTSTASSIHQIRAVLQVQASGNGTCSYAFTSPRRGAGKTSVAIGVASSLAVSGTRTLVVDCDLAGRIVRGQTGIPADPRHIDPFGPIDRQTASGRNESLDDIAVGQGYIDDQHAAAPTVQPTTANVGVVGMLEGGTLEQCAVKATVDGLYLLPAAGAETRHIGMLSDAFIRRVLAEAREQYDLVLFDTGPVPGSVEALLVTSQVDGVVVIIPHGESGKSLDRTMSYLKVVGAKVIGTVFNQVNASAQRARGNDPDAPQSAAEYGAREDVVDDIGQEIDDALEHVPLGSGILAAAVFADENSVFASDDWELRETSDFANHDETAERSSASSHGSASNNGSGTRHEQHAVSDILPPE